ncbi:MAG: hypothetical protein KME46_16465 [Brasilonema angustatum HA4187-MV1]|nr:hypothetical protein [Brasilonema angustatum HA4187-MV1]
MAARAKEKTTAEVAEVRGYSREWIRRLARRYNQQGVCALCDRRYHSS